MTSAESARAPRYPSGAEYTDPGHPDVEVTVDLTRVNMVHSNTPCGDRREYEFAAVEIFVTGGDGQLLQRVPATAARLPASSPNVASTGSDADVSRTNTRYVRATGSRSITKQTPRLGTLCAQVPMAGRRGRCFASSRIGPRSAGAGPMR